MTHMIWIIHRKLRSKSEDLDESRRSFEPKRTILWVKADDLTEADDPDQSGRSFYIIDYQWMQTILTYVFCYKSYDPWFSWMKAHDRASSWNQNFIDQINTVVNKMGWKDGNTMFPIRGMSFLPHFSTW